MNDIKFMDGEHEKFFWHFLGLFGDTKFDEYRMSIAYLLALDRICTVFKEIAYWRR